MSLSQVRRVVVAGLAAITVAQLGVVSSVLTSPWLVSRLIRIAFDRDSRRVAARMATHVPSGGTSALDVGYRPADRVARLDVHRHGPAIGPRPVLVWIHGGGWLSGSKSDVAPYLRILCAEAPGKGFVAVGLDYTRGPEGRYPLALHQINDALGYLVEHADELGIDPDRIVLAGDSAGAQLASQYAAMVTHADLATRVGVAPTISAAQLSGLVLHCGVYDMAAFHDLPPAVRWAYRRIVWAWTGTLDIQDNRALQEMSTTDWVTAAFPPALISGGNGDPLTDPQSRRLVARLRELNVPTTAYFYESDHLPTLAHEYQFDLDGADGAQMMRHTQDFLAERFGRG